MFYTTLQQMTVTALLDYIKSNRSKIKSITDADLIQIEAQVNATKELHPEAEELELFFYQNLEANNFKVISKLAEAKDFFPDIFLAELTQKAIDKLEKINIALTPPYGDFSKILYVKEVDFYVFLNHLKTPETEEKLKSVLEKLEAIYHQDSGSDLVGKAFIAVNNYKALDYDLSSLIDKTKYAPAAVSSPFFSKSTKQYLIYGVVTLLVLVRLSFFISAIKQRHRYDPVDYDTETQYKSEPRKIDRYYTQMKFQIDSFFVFLADYKKEEIKQLTSIDTVKTGQNPFETFYQSLPQGESNNFIKVKNNTNLDMILLENATVFDTIKLPKAAYYIKAGKTLEVTKRETDAKSVFNIYLGKKLATFQTNSKHLFIRNHSVVEYRFSELIPSTKEILKTDYRFVKDASIALKNGVLKIN